MAIWQIAFQLVPSNSLGFSDAFILDPQALKTLENEFPRGQSWHENNMVYGFLDGTCVELFYHESKLDEISVKIHVGEVSPKTICCIIKFAQYNDLKILYDDEIFEANMDNVTHLIKNSKAYLYIHNNSEFWKELHERSQS